MHLLSIIQTVKISLAYFLFVIFLPSLILRNRFKKEEMTKRFFIYLVYGNFYLSTIVFGLSYLNLFNRLTLLLSILFLSVIIYIGSNRHHFLKKTWKTKETTKEVLLGEYGFRLYFSKMLKDRLNYLKRVYQEVFAENKLEWLIFLAIIFYNVYQYGINSMEYTTYIAPDEEVHLYWIQSLVQGNIYPSGVYPHVFHTILAALIKLFNFNGMRMILYFSSTSIILIMTTLYIGLRKILKSKYAALLGLLLYSTLDLFIEHATYRYQFTIPQEYGMIMLLPMAIFLFDYIKEQKKSDLLFFGIALALTFGIHPYTGAIALVLTLSIGLVYFYKIIKEKLFFKLILVGLLSLLLALVPMGIGLATGHELEQSFSWGAEVIKGDVYSTTSESVAKEELEDNEEATSVSFNQFITGAKLDLKKYLIPKSKKMLVLLILMLFSVMYNLFAILYHRGDLKSEYQLAFALNNFLLFTLILFKALNLPTIMEPKRIAIYFAYFSAIFLGMPLELMSRLLNKTKLKKAVPVLSIGGMGLGLFLVFQLNILRPLPPFYYFQPSGTMLANIGIMEEYEDYTWTTVSPVNNITAVLNHGYHYELSDFILQQEDWQPEKEIKIPSENVFLYVEKMPIIQYGSEFHRGDDALKNRPLVTKDEAQMELSESTGENYHYKNERNILMAKAYYWAEEYKEYFPKEIDTYYEDEELIVYRIKQNQYALNNLNINYQMNSR